MCNEHIKAAEVKILNFVDAASIDEIPSPVRLHKIFLEKKL